MLAACQAGDEIVSMLDVYGGTVKLFEQVLPRCGIKMRFIPYHDIDNAARYFSRKTRMLFLESPTNPTLRCVDLAALCELGRKRKACVVVDNTFATPVLQKPLELGADIVIHSATKYLGGHSDLTAGVLAGSKKWMDLARPMMILTGGCLDPGCAYLLLRGLKTLDVRVERACRNAARIADMLQQHPKIARVYYPGLPDNDSHEIARRQMKDFGMMVSFDLRGGGRCGGAVYRQSDIVVPRGQPRRSGIDGVVSGARLAHWLEREATQAAGSVSCDGAAVGRDRR